MEATAKWDGTNVGKGSDGRMLGRRMVISPHAKEYQRTPLIQVKAADIAKVKEELFDMLGLK